MTLIKWKGRVKLPVFFFLLSFVCAFLMKLISVPCLMAQALLHISFCRLDPFLFDLFAVAERAHFGLRNKNCGDVGPKLSRIF